MTTIGRITLLAWLGWLAIATNGLAGPSEEPVITIRVHDYAHLPGESMTRAQQRVAAIYSAIGVRTRWQTIMLSTQEPEAGPTDVLEPRELLVIVLNRSMEHQKVAAGDVVGTAVVTEQGEGRVAYVFFDRVSLIAKASTADTMDVLGMVMAHEIGHLMLPGGSHSPAGLMRPKWTADDLRNASRAPCGFTALQSDLIRRRLLRWALVPLTSSPSPRVRPLSPIS